MPLSWGFVILCIAAGLAFRGNAFLLPVLFTLGWWILQAITGNFDSHGSGDNIAAEAALTWFIAAIAGFLGVAGGLVIRRLLARRSPSIG